jgi:hypothetical protein
VPVDVWVENHQPVPLAPLRDLELRSGSVVFIGTRVVSRRARVSDLADTGPLAPPEIDVFAGPDAPGWVVYDGQGHFHAADTPDDRWLDDTMDWDRSLGRLLQPGEALHVRYTTD